MTEEVGILRAGIKGALYQIDGIDTESDTPKIQDTAIWKAGNARDILSEALKEASEVKK